MIIPWGIFFCHLAATIGVVQVVRPDLVFVMRMLKENICVSVLIYC